MTMFNVEHARLLVPGFHPDPSICKDDSGAYYLVFSSFEYFPGIPIYRSADCVTWEQIGHVLSRPSQLPGEAMGNSQGIYAPTIRFHDGTFYVITTNVNVGNFIVTATDPAGPWSEPVWLPQWPSIDPSLFFDDDGLVYICGADSAAENGEPAGVYQARIDLYSGNLLTPRQLMCQGITGTNPEAPHMYKRAGKYYLMWAEGGTEAGHMENIAVATSPMGPFDLYPGNPLITNRSTHLPLQAVGHCDLVERDDGTVFMVFLGTRMEDSYPVHSWLGREPFGATVTWDDVWPALSDQSYTFDADAAQQLAHEVTQQTPDWITPTPDRDGRYHVTNTRDESGNHDFSTVDIRAIDQDFGLEKGPSFIGMRQVSYRARFSADVEAPLEEGTAGIVAYQNHDHYLTLSVLRAGHGSGVRVSFEAVNAGLTATVGAVDLDGSVPASPIRLVIEATDRGYHGQVDCGGDAHELGFIPGTVLDLTNAGGFTGTVLGLFAHGVGEVNFGPVVLSAGGRSE